MKEKERLLAMDVVGHTWFYIIAFSVETEPVFIYLNFFPKLGLEHEILEWRKLDDKVEILARLLWHIKSKTLVSNVLFREFGLKPEEVPEGAKYAIVYPDDPRKMRTDLNPEAIEFLLPEKMNKVLPSIIPDINRYLRSHGIRGRGFLVSSVSITDAKVENLTYGDTEADMTVTIRIEGGARGTPSSRPSQRRSDSERLLGASSRVWTVR